MREFTPLGVEWVANALKTSDALEVDEESKNVRRRTEVTEPKGQFERSIYAVSVCHNCSDHVYTASSDTRGCRKVLERKPQGCSRI